jgi:eukaryotic-like serine/threonine-protein kinase
MQNALPIRVRLGPFAVDLKAGELHRGERKARLQEQPFQILLMLVERSGNLVTLEEIKKKLWPNDTVVEFDHSIHTAMKKLRQALEDSAENPRYIETVARRGYRLIMPVESLDSTPGDGPASDEDSSSHDGNEAQSKPEPGVLIGKKLSHYRVLEVVGGGGMGMVYKAEDLKLGRRVALKFLPEELATDSLTLQRFEREARTASSLNHPNICTIHEVEEHEGQPFIVMELMEGETLRDRLASVTAGGKAISLHELLDIAVQIAAGLQAAHEKGIIHRDIKPANIFLTIQGQVKILDFGLAKLTVAATGIAADERGEDGAHGVQTKARRETAIEHSLSRTGMAMGTAGYMSPEQARGEKLDARSDLFSFGMVLYEMATGQRAFSGDTAAILKDAILNHTPAPVRELNSTLPLRLEQIINKALEKNREQRYQHASEIRADLTRLIPRKEPSRAGARRRLVVGGVIALLLVGVSLWWVKRQSSFPREVPELKQRQLTSNSTEDPVAGGSISPDGRYLAYADLRGIHIKELATGEMRTVPQPEELSGLQVNWGIPTNWVADGSRFVANANIAGKPSSIWVIAMVGGAPRKLRNDAYAWAVSRGDPWVAFTTDLGRVNYREMWRMRPDGEQASKLFESDENSGFYGADWSPDGQRLSYLGYREAANKRDVSVESRDLKGGPAIVAVPQGVADWTWSPDGRIIYVRGEEGAFAKGCNFWSIRIDRRSGEPSGTPRRLTNWAGFCMNDPTVTANGKQLAFRKLAAQTTVYVANLEPSGLRIAALRRLALDEGMNYPAAWTADSKAVIYQSYRDGQWTILKKPLDENVGETVVARVKDAGGAPATVSPDGTWVLYPDASNKDGSPATPPIRLMRVAITGGSPELVLSGPIYQGPACAKSPARLCVIAEPTADHKQLAFTAFDPVKGRGGELSRFDTNPTQGAHYVWDLSPDGTRIAILKHSSGAIDILPLNGQASQKVVVKGWSSLLSLNWAADGKSVFASSETKKGAVLLRVDLRGNASVLWEQNGSVAPWNRPEGAGRVSAPWAIPSPDGRHVAIYDWKLSANMWMMENF